MGSTRSMHRNPRSPKYWHISWKVRDRKSTRLNSSHLVISYAVFCLKKKNHSEDMERSADDPIERDFATARGDVLRALGCHQISCAGRSSCRSRLPHSEFLRPLRPIQ